MFQHAAVLLENGIGEATLLDLEFGDFFLDGAATDQAVGKDLLGLADAVRAVDRLGFDGGVPPRVQEEHVIGGREIQTEATGFQADQEQRAVRIVLEAFDTRAAIAGLAVEAQAIDRAHRVGQTKQVFAYRLICRGTVEEKIAELQVKKRGLADAILQENGSVLEQLSAEDLEMLLS